jgi:heme oxygenase
MTDLRERLKTKTQELHWALERDLDLFNSIQTLTDYAGLLSRFAGYYKVIESRMHSAVRGTSHEAVVAEREKLPRLLADLRYCRSVLGLELPYDTAVNVPAFNSVPAVYGAIYVLEGATLGGQIISRHIRQALSLGPHDGTTFFGNYGVRVQDAWRDFCVRLAQWNEYEAEVTASALATFSSLHQWLCNKTESCNGPYFADA